MGFTEAPDTHLVPPSVVDVEGVLSDCCALCLQPIPPPPKAEGAEWQPSTGAEFVPRLGRVVRDGEAYHAVCGNLWFSLAPSSSS